MFAIRRKKAIVVSPDSAFIGHVYSGTMPNLMPDVEIIRYENSTESEEIRDGYYRETYVMFSCFEGMWGVDIVSAYVVIVLAHNSRRS